jgi:mono/diheme cytochrome c family protein
LATWGLWSYYGKKPVPSPGPEPSPGISEETQLARGKEVFTTYCAACHGDKGDGNGPAARFLNPKPRDFRTGSFRIVSTVNRRPSDDDLLLVITNGMPGSAMFPFAHLSEADRKALVGHVRQLWRTGLEEVFRAKAEESGEEFDSSKVERLVQTGELATIPPAPPSVTAESVARGANLYRVKGCAACHGETGRGDGVQEQRNEDGAPTSPRDFTLGIFKSGQDRRQLYARILLGMPGSPMPGSPTFTTEEIDDLVNFVQSLSPPGVSAKVEHKRQQLVAHRATASLSAGLDEDVWNKVPAVPVVVSPLWWRPYVPPDFTVQALHDGQTLALRLTWKDATCNNSVARPEDFEDMAAVQFFQGGPEPFLGMGAEGANVDLWQWRAGWHNPNGTAGGTLDDYPFDTPFYREKLKGQAIPDFLTARAAGNQHVHADASQTAASLGARGFGSTTFRPRTSQRVTAQSAWKDGRWTVVLRRPLQVGADEGLSLGSGKECSVAFALWDGAARDRNGQKLVSIWHSLKIE